MSTDRSIVFARWHPYVFLESTCECVPRPEDISIGSAVFAGQPAGLTRVTKNPTRIQTDSCCCEPASGAVWAPFHILHPTSLKGWWEPWIKFWERPSGPSATRPFSGRALTHDPIVGANSASPAPLGDRKGPVARGWLPSLQDLYPSLSLSGFDHLAFTFFAVVF